MQNYETLLAETAPVLKNVKDAANTVVRLQKAAQKNTEIGNLTETKKTLAALTDATALLKERIEALSAQIDSFDEQEYFVSGDFTRQLLEACGQKEINELFLSANWFERMGDPF